VRVRFERVEVWNFLSYASESFDYPEHGMYLVMGLSDSNEDDSNGSGKSGLFVEAPVWILFGKTIRNVQVGKVVRIGQNLARGILYFWVGDTRYCVSRVRPKDAAPTTKLSMFQGNEWVDISGTSLSDTDDKIVRVLGFSYELFKNSVLYGQGLPYRFIQSPDSDKKAIMEEILALEWVQRAQDNAKGVIRGYRQLISTLETRKTGLTSRASTQREHGDRLSIRRSVLVQSMALASLMGDLQREKEQAQRAMEAAEYEYEAGDRSALEVAQADVARVNRDLTEVVADLSRFRATEREKNKELIEYQRQLAKMSRPGTPCPTCERPWESGAVHAAALQLKITTVMEDIRERIVPQIGVLERRGVVLTTERQNLELGARELRKRTDRLLLELRNRTSVYNAVVLQYQEAVGGQEARTREMATLDEDLTRLGSEIQEIEAELVDVDSSMHFLNDILAYLVFWENGFSNRGIKAHVLQVVIPYLNSRAAHYSHLLTDGDYAVTFSVSEPPQERFEVTVQNSGLADYSQSSGGERRRVDVVVLLALCDLVMHRNGVNVSLQVFDEVAENLDAGGVERLVGVLEIVSRDRAVFLISHNAAFADLFQNQITVEKAGGISRIVRGG